MSQFFCAWEGRMGKTQVGAGLRIIGFGVLHTILAAATLAQTSYVWTNGNNTYNASGSWSVPQNWKPLGPANGTGNTADFSQVTSYDSSADTVTLDGTYTIGTLHFGDAAGSGHAWNLNTGSGGPLTLNVSSGTPNIIVDAGQAATINAVLAGTGFTKNSDGVLTLACSTSNTFTGQTTVAGGNFVLDAPSGIKSLGGDLVITGSAISGTTACYVIESNNEQLVDSAVVTISTTGGGMGTWELMGNSQTIAGLQDNGHGNVEIAESPSLAAGSSTLTLNETGTYTYGGRIREYNSCSGYCGGTSGLFNVIKNGPGTQIFMGPHAPQWSGLTLVNQGRFVIGSNAVNTAGIISNNATVELHTDGSYSFQVTPPPTFCGTGTLVKTGFETIFFGYVNNPGDGGAVLSMGTNGLIDIEQGTLQNFNGSGNWTNNKASLNVASGASLEMDDNSVWVDALTGGGVVDEGYVNGSPQTLTIGVAGTSGTFSGVVQSTGTTILSLVKTGTGTQRLVGADTYTGATTVSNGTLLVDNSSGSGTGSGAVSVLGGATLGGLGSIAGPVSLAAGAVLQPGDPVNALTVNNNLVLNNASVLQYALGSNSAETVVNGNLTLGGTLNITNAGGFTTGTYVLFTYSGELTYNGLTIGTKPNTSYTYTVSTNTAGQVNLIVTSSCSVGPAGPISGSTSVNSGASGVAYSISSVSGASIYTWTVPSGISIASGQGTTSITVNYSCSANSGSITVTPSNGSCSSTATNLSVTVTGVGTAGSISGLTSVCAGQAGLGYSISSVNGATTYSWTVPSGATITGGQGTTSITVTWGSTAGSVQVMAANANGCAGTGSSLPVTVMSPPGVLSGPSQQSVCAGGSASFTVSASGAGLGYQWQKNSSNISDGGTVSGSRTTTLTLSGVGTGDSGASFDCVVSGTCSPPATSGAATLTVNANPAIFNVTGGGSSCAVAVGVTVGLDGSESSADYQLEVNGEPTGAPVSGTGGAISFTNETTMGVYTITASNVTTGCTSTMNGSASVSSIDPFTCWQLQYFDSTNCALCSGTASYTGDGMSNTNKFMAGFSPTNAAAYLQIITIANANTNDIKVTYLGASGDSTYVPGIASRTNVLDYTTGDANGNYTNGAWQDTYQTNILSGGNGLGTVTNMTDIGGATNGPSRYYRVRVLLP
jgi:autotransporter-associated beta strand protein